MSEEKKAFWSSLPGVLSGIAAIIGAVATFYVTVIKDDDRSARTDPAPFTQSQAGNFSESSQSSTPLRTSEQGADWQANPQGESRQPDAALPAVTQVGFEPSARSASAPSAGSLSEQILGIWYVETQGPTQAGRMQLRGTTQYFRNGSSTTVMEVTLYEQLPTGNEIAITYDAIATAEWQIHNRELIEKTVSLKSVPKYLIIDGFRTPVEQLEFAVQQELPKLEDITPIGSSSSTEIVDIQPSQIVLNSRDVNNNTIRFAATRTDKHFSPSP